MEDEKRQSGSSRKISSSVDPLGGDDEPKNTIPGSSISRKGDPSSNPLASEKGVERSPTISILNRDGLPGNSPKHDGGQEDAPSGNRISKEDIASSNPINDGGSHASAPPISVGPKKDDTAGNAPKSSRQCRIASSGESASRKSSPPVNRVTRGSGGAAWFCGHCNSGPMNIERDFFCTNCMCKRDAYSYSSLTSPKARR